MTTFVTKRLQAHHKSDLDLEVSQEEVRFALFSIHSNKSPGPTGFNAFFFKQVWHIIGADFTTTIQYFFTSGYLLREVNNIATSLIPKVQNPSRVNDYRPISYCNTIYKCINKILANRLKNILPDLIDSSQPTFIKGRSIRDNILLA